MECILARVRLCCIADLAVRQMNEVYYLEQLIARYVKVTYELGGITSLSAS